MKHLHAIRRMSLITLLHAGLGLMPCAATATATAVAPTAAPVETAGHRAERMAWWNDARFGDKAYLLTAPGTALKTSSTAEGTRLSLPATAPDPIASVIVIELANANAR